MSVDRSLRIQSSLTRHRNVLTRAERVQVLVDKADWDSSKSALGLPKIAHRKGKAGRKKEKEEKAAATPTTEDTK